ncbi:Uncharacterised protein [Enterobacter cloacae]|nr:Uncharacterised protein [Enterobacter cloacae]
MAEPRAAQSQPDQPQCLALRRAGQAGPGIAGGAAGVAGHAGRRAPAGQPQRAGRGRYRPGPARHRRAGGAARAGRFQPLVGRAEFRPAGVPRPGQRRAEAEPDQPVQCHGRGRRAPRPGAGVAAGAAVQPGHRRLQRVRALQRAQRRTAEIQGRQPGEHRGAAGEAGG